MAPWLLLSLDSCQRRRTNDRANFSSQKKKSSSCYVQPACSTQIYTKIMSNKIDIHKKRISTLMLGKTSSMGNVGKGILCWNLYTPWKIHVEPEFSPVFVKGKSSSNQPMIFGLPHVPQKRPSLTFHYTGCSIGILIMVHNSYNPHLTG